MFDPEKVERLDPELGEHYYGGNFATMEESPVGDYVRASDYDQLLELYRGLANVHHLKFNNTAAHDPQTP